MKNIFKSILFSIITLAVGFVVMAAPFHLFKTLTGNQMRVLFLAEIIIYFAIISAVMLIKEKRYNQKHAKKSCASRRTQSFMDMQCQIAEPVDYCDNSASFTKVA